MMNTADIIEALAQPAPEQRLIVITPEEIKAHEARVRNIERDANVRQWQPESAS